MSSWSTSRKTNGSGGNYCKGCQDRDRLIDELEDERRRLARMTTDNKLGGMTSPKTEAPTGRRWGNYFEYDPPKNFDELVKRYEERRSFNRMVITGAVSAYCIALFILSSMRNEVKEDLRNLCNNYD
ncbi:hypothetical protein OsI_24789 [Oryza sativa Indica Group]|uniref:Uncharacterized protein n=2 Tax=Oryza TaxID=4527 RepID=A0A0E0Q3Q5_ORYRU|nr:hypothetical protein OsI_24789 [Oryza sativa Indica Group]